MEMLGIQGTEDCDETQNFIERILRIDWRSEIDLTDVMMLQE